MDWDVCVCGQGECACGGSVFAVSLLRQIFPTQHKVTNPIDMELSAYMLICFRNACARGFV